MGSILGGIVAAVIVAFVAGFVLDEEQRPAWEVFTSEQSARIDDPGNNLVGPNWNGENVMEQGGSDVRL